jgi:hypothetical protein
MLKDDFSGFVEIFCKTEGDDFVVAVTLADWKKRFGISNTLVSD